MERAMNKKYLSAAQKLHNFVSEDTDLTDAEIQAALKAEGVDGAGFLTRLGSEVGHSAEQNQPTTRERLRALASRAGDGMKKLVGEGKAVTKIPGVSVAYGRKRKSKSSGKKPNHSSKRTR